MLKKRHSSALHALDGSARRIPIKKAMQPGMPEKADSTSQQGAVPPSTQWHLDAMSVEDTMQHAAPDATLKRERTGPTRAAAPPTLTLPAIPKEMTQPQMPAILSPHLVKPDNAKLESHPT